MLFLVKMTSSIRQSLPTVLTIAGFDPSCGAGVVADLKTIAACGAYGIATVSALTIQNTIRVAQVVPVDSKVLEEQINCLWEDIQPKAVKVGMLATRLNVEVVARFLKDHRLLNVVVDPVFCSSSGASLLEPEALPSFIGELLPLADCLTPNLDEAQRLTGLAVNSVDEMKKAAERIHQMGCRSVVVTGGHLKKATDVFFDGKHFRVLSHPLIETRNTHGTGCTFSSAIACYTALGLPFEEAIVKAKEFVTEALHQSYSVGRGHGPLNHFFKAELK